MRSALGVALVVLTTSSVAFGQENLGGPGESCRARPDCKTGLKCLDNKCIDEHEGQSCGATPDCGTELKCIDNHCVNPNAPRTKTKPKDNQEPVGGKKWEQEDEDNAAPSAAMQEWMHFALKGVHPFVGLTFAVGAVNGGYTTTKGSAWGSGADGGLVLAVRGGVFINRHEIALEIAPMTYVWDFQAPGPAFAVGATYAYFIPLTQGETVRLYYPLRAGVGTFLGGANTGSNVFFEARADLVGLGMKIGHVMLDAHLPSFRYALTKGFFAGVGDATQHVLSWYFGFSASYIF